MIRLCVKFVHLGPHQVLNFNLSVKNVRVDVAWGKYLAFRYSH